MTSLTVPAELVTLLGQLKERTELRDAAGKVIGVFTPEAESQAPQSEDRVEPWTPEEADRLWEESRDQPWHTLEEIWRKLGRTKSCSE